MIRRFVTTAVAAAAIALAGGAASAEQHSGESGAEGASPPSEDMRGSDEGGFSSGSSEGTSGEPGSMQGSTGEPTGGDYVVQEGDTLAKIAESRLGSADEWQRIAQENGIDDPKKLEVGKRLTIPAPSGSRSGVGGERPSAGSESGMPGAGEEDAARGGMEERSGSGASGTGGTEGRTGGAADDSPIRP